MASLLVLRFDGVGQAEYEAVNEALGIDAATGEGDWPPGLLSHAAGMADATATVVEVWESREDQARFMEERLGAALQAGGVTDPPSSVEWIELVSYVTTT
jgi:hypothetical protein